MEKAFNFRISRFEIGYDFNDCVLGFLLFAKYGNMNL